MKNNKLNKKSSVSVKKIKNGYFIEVGTITSDTLVVSDKEARLLIMALSELIGKSC